MPPAFFPSARSTSDLARLIPPDYADAAGVGVGELVDDGFLLVARDVVELGDGDRDDLDFLGRELAH